jgi:hypothetical protein
MSPTHEEFIEVFERVPTEHVDLLEYWNAPSIRGGAWENKPHRLLYTLIREVYHLRKALQKEGVDPITGTVGRGEGEDIVRD